MANRRDGVNIPRIWVAIALSIALHAALMWSWRYEIRFPSEGQEHDRGPLVVQIVPRRSPPPAPRIAPQPEPQRPPAVASPTPAKPAPKPPPKAVPKPRPEPPVLARREPAPNAPVVRPPTPPAPATTPPRPPEGDLSALVEARRRARGEVASPAPPPAEATSGSGSSPEEDANARATRLAAANLGSDRRPNFGSDPRKGGGVFMIERLGYDTAAFTFFGWSKDIQRNTLQTIEVRKGNQSDIRIAVVRRMIAVIREQEKEDFVWESKRLGRNVTLSARQSDNSGLEGFLMHEFFEASSSP